MSLKKILMCYYCLNLTKLFFIVIFILSGCSVDRQKSVKTESREHYPDLVDTSSQKQDDYKKAVAEAQEKIKEALR